MNKYQEELCAQIQHLLSSEIAFENIENVGFKEVFVAMVRHYAEITPELKKAYSDKSYSLYKKYHKIGIRAAKILDEYKGNEKNIPNNKRLHAEHMPPVSVIRKQLTGLGFAPSLEDVKKVLADYEVILITKEEANVLDGSPTKKYLIDGKPYSGLDVKSKGTKEERINALKLAYDSRYANNSLNKKSNKSCR